MYEQVKFNAGYGVKTKFKMREEKDGKFPNVKEEFSKRVDVQS